MALAPPAEKKGVWVNLVQLSDTTWHSHSVQILWDAIRSLIANDGVELAGYVAFTALLAFFPFLIFLAALAGMLGSYDSAMALIDFLFRFAPEDVAKTLSPPLLEVLGQRRGGTLTISLLFSVWAASSGVDAVRLVLNRAYGSKEMRSIWRQKLQSIVFVLIGGSFIFVVAFFILLGPLIWKLLQWLFPFQLQDDSLWIVGRYALGALLITALSTMLHRFLPVRAPRWREIMPGAITTSLMWLGLAGLFTIYLSELANYGSTYGALAGVIVTLLFFDLTALIFIFGAELNASLCRAARTAELDGSGTRSEGLALTERGSRKPTSQTRAKE